MHPIEARRSERVRYRAPVEVWAGEGDDPQPVLAEARDLGAGGMRIRAKVRMEVGAHVTCRFSLDGHDTAFSGKVAWLANGERDHGMGICFDPLGSQESALVQHMLERSRAGPRTVELRFDGEALDRDGTRFRRHARYGYPDEIEAEEQRNALAPRVAPSSASAPESARVRRAPRKAMLIAGCAGAIAGWLAAPRIEPASELEAAPVQTQRMTRTQPVARELGAAPTSPAPEHAVSIAAREPEPTRVPSTPVGELAAETKPSPAEPNAKPILVIEDGATRVLLPFEGTLSHMQTTLWASPSAVAITLPEGRVPLAEGRHRLDAGGLGDLRIHHRGDQQLLRLMLERSIARYGVAQDGGTLELRIVHAPSPAPNP